MILSNSNKFIFIKTRKCGGTSIQNALIDFCNQDDFVMKGFTNLMNRRVNPFEEFSSLGDIKKYTNINLDDYFKFGFARNPYSITLSRYLYQVRLGRIFGEPNKDGFNQWIKNTYFDEKSMFNYTNDGTRKLLFDSDGNKIVDFIGKLENIDNDFNYVKNRLKININIQLKKDNVSNIDNIHYVDWMNEESKSLVDKHFKFEIEYFNYKY